jgi:hypothetical protein
MYTIRPTRILEVLPQIKRLGGSHQRDQYYQRLLHTNPSAVRYLDLADAA